jgi:hypothetical protein
VYASHRRESLAVASVETDFDEFLNVRCENPLA